MPRSGNVALCHAQHQSMGRVLEVVVAEDFVYKHRIAKVDFIVRPNRCRSDCAWVLHWTAVISDMQA